MRRARLHSRAGMAERSGKPRQFAAAPGWQGAPSNRRPAPGEVDVWWCPTHHEPQDLRRFANTLDERERVRAAAFRFDKDRHRFVARHALTRDILGRALGAAPKDVRLLVSEHGRPVLDASAIVGTPLSFSVSHRAEVALVAVALDAPLGVDVEALRELPDLDGLVRLVLTEGETALGLGSTSEAFLRHWARKEALLKALGQGLLIDPSTVHLTPRDHSGKWWWAHRFPDLRVGDLDLGPSHVGAVCLGSDPHAILRWSWTPRDAAPRPRSVNEIRTLSSPGPSGPVAQGVI